MTALFELPLPSETLAADELSEITGAKTHDGPLQASNHGARREGCGNYFMRMEWAANEPHELPRTRATKNRSMESAG